MEDILLLETIERYLSGNMLPEEKNYFEQLRKSTPEIDQMVVEHKLFLQQIEHFSEHKNLKAALHATHNELVENGDVYEGNEINSRGRVVQLWNKYKRVTAIAASIAGVTAIVISGLTAYFSASPNQKDIDSLSRKINNLEKTTTAINSELKNKEKHINENFVSGGTGFLIDGKGYIITNAHVLKGSGAVVVNNKGQEFNARIVNINNEKDLAVLKIDDDDYKPVSSLPYSIKKADVDLGEELFTLGYPREQIVYSMGYMSAASGYDGDTSSCQISLSANPGNSGGPVFNKNGEIIGVLSSRQTSAEGVVFAIKAKNIYQLVDQLKESDTAVQRIKMPSNSSLKGKTRVEQVKDIEDCVFLVKAYTQK